MRPHGSLALRSLYSGLMQDTDRGVKDGDPTGGEGRANGGQESEPPGSAPRHSLGTPFPDFCHLFVTLREAKIFKQAQTTLTIKDTFERLVP